MVSTASRTGRELQRYDNGCRQVVGCIPYKYRKTNQLVSVGGTLVEELEVLLISSQKCEKMMFPKGGWETDEFIEEAAKRETIEEAGVDGVVGSKLGSWKFKSKSQGTFNEGHMFPLFVTDEFDIWPEKNVRQRKWMTVNEAREVCYHGWMKEALDIFVAQKEGEANQKPCSSQFLRTEEPRIAFVAQKQRKMEEKSKTLFITIFENGGNQNRNCSPKAAKDGKESNSLFITIFENGGTQNRNCSPKAAKDGKESNSLFIRIFENRGAENRHCSPKAAKEGRESKSLFIRYVVH
ncbi:hypothetical protein F0562_025359 [Nyssa sinensis]|uniref:Nudix hydrolase domain-containing protein n=1 Tax=Nyssa sinensis TaxID=561372 RepID=A0A5J5BFI3_9ASTE|nr:hypothetical protein F0562_025359 [Nyssa sinensis]